MNSSFLIIILISIIYFISGSTGSNFTLNEFESLEKIRERLLRYGDKYTENWLEETPNGILINYLGFHEFDLDKAEANLRETIEWRKSNKIENIYNWETPELLKQLIPYYITGINENDGRLVLYLPSGKWDIREASLKASRNDLVRHFVKMSEIILAQIIQRIKDQKVPQNLGQHYTLANLEGINFGQISSVRALATFTSIIGLLEKHYPFIAIDIRLINAPTIFQTVLDLIKAILSSRTIDRLHVFRHGDQSWTENFSKNVIPQTLGGDFIE